MNFQKGVRRLSVVAALILSALPGQAYAADAKNDEAQIYSQVLNHLARGIRKNERLSVVVSSDSMLMEDAYREISQSPPTSLEDDITWRLKHAKKETVKNFVEQSAAVHAVRFLSTTLSKRVTASLASKARINEMFGDDHAKGWERFARQYPGARHLIYFSSIGFDPTRSEALVYMHRVCVGLCGSGELILLRQVRGRWLVRDVHQFWIS